REAVEVKGYRRNWDCACCGHPLLYLPRQHKLICSCSARTGDVDVIELRTLWHPLSKPVLLWSCGCVSFNDRDQDKEAFFINPCSATCIVVEEVLRKSKELGHPVELRRRT
ncbi:MAG: hypothetical protein OEX09_02010, partial [Candidatus Bathyarchaeota archaeon]|nr:hypothetical protein [Candidatus Bathyarchaeota archaeon]